MYCKNCGKCVSDEATECVYCGQPFARPWSAITMVAWTVAAIWMPMLGIIAGVYGIAKDEKRRQGIFLLFFSLAAVLFYSILRQRMGY